MIGRDATDGLGPDQARVGQPRKRIDPSLARAFDGEVAPLGAAAGDPVLAGSS